MDCYFTVGGSTLILTRLYAVILRQLHDSPLRGHSGFHKTLQRVHADLLWHGLRKFVWEYVCECDICQRMKGKNTCPAGLLQPLPGSWNIWTDISKDFIDALPRSLGHEAVMVVADRLSKYAPFIPLAHPYTATYVAHVFLDQIFKLHGMPLSIISDRDPVFTSTFWRELSTLQGSQLKCSSAYHPQTYG